MPRPLRDVSPRELLAALPAALDGTGPAVRVGGDGDGDGHRASVPDEVALVVRTSGSTGAPRDVGLTAQALTASATATARRLGGPGRWLLALPTDHVAGAQVLIRSVLAGTNPVVMGSGPFRAGVFVDATRQLDGPAPRYTSLVPTQLVRLLEDPAATAALRGFDAVLVGGAALAPALQRRALDAGVPAVTTYGATETCGGAVYDGRPLPGVRVAVGPDERVRIAGPVLAHGYLDRPDLDAGTFVEADGERWFVTSDLGRLDPDGRLHVLGRADDVLVTGGVNVAPAAVEAVVATLPGVQEVCVVGLGDEQWGQAVTAVVVPRAGRPPDLADLRSATTAALGTAAAPRHLVLVDALPLRGPGKPDRQATTRLAREMLDRQEVARGRRA
ncbi:MAG: o-succinylbenzoate--CoA ligase [Cellulomonas sp.]|nr:o-succinylbenzoate--CoA ligase [Cellulomonas sp.]